MTANVYEFRKVLREVDLCRDVAALSVLVVVFLFMGEVVAWAQEPADVSGEQRLVQQWMHLYDEIIDSFQVTAGAPGAEFELDRRKVLVVTNPKQRARHGYVYLFTHNGQPTMIGSLMSVQTKNDDSVRTVAYEFHSLVEDPITVLKASNHVWTCDQPGVTWIAMEDTQPPSADPARRLIQMRSIARRYSVSLTGASKQLVEDCRLLPQPIYRYPASTPGVDDGAIFAYVTSNNPKVYLLTEARSGSWHVALARSGEWELKIKRDNTLVHTFENGTFVKPGPFYMHYTAEYRRADDPKSVIRLHFPD